MMPIISPHATKKTNAIAYAIYVMQDEGMFNTSNEEHLNNMFLEGGFILKNDNHRSRLQISNSILYKHWKSANEPKIYRKLISTHRGINAAYSLNSADQFKAYEETL